VKSPIEKGWIAGSSSAQPTQVMGPVDKMTLA